MRIRTTAAVLAVPAALLAGCSSGSSKSAPEEPGVATSAPATVKAITGKQADAATVTKQLAAAVPSVKLTVTYTEATDPNSRMGRPHQYVSKTAFADSRVSTNPKAKDEADGRPDAISYGGTVEVFAADADAKAWVDGIDKMGQAVSSLVTPDYLLRQGRYVIRASDLLTPGQVAEYKAVLAKLD
ncbi:hypothetical protein VSR01_01375 [Actinacidiphila sp. DG2A-62]|uniref:hypothetical protein n=1 Tax=Actinacidiphila sp. DG2A-62 TaxID=3108821 RepID=UPI002DB57429|nr:hypothetical protein [Actinacidiphila sp. DG2A-62]MEC3992266.1 hypothetical protein [Actinacidiphila sp. DG2A-62]